MAALTACSAVARLAFSAARSASAFHRSSLMRFSSALLSAFVTSCCCCSAWTDEEYIRKVKQQNAQQGLEGYWCILGRFWPGRRALPAMPACAHAPLCSVEQFCHPAINVLFALWKRPVSSMTRRCRCEQAWMLGFRSSCSFCSAWDSSTAYLDDRKTDTHACKHASGGLKQ